MARIADVSPTRNKPADTAAWWIAALTLATAWLIYARPWLFGGLVIPWDAKDFYYPVLRFLAASLAQGESGQWNPYLYGGMSAIADPQSWYFTPTFRLFAALIAAPSMTAMDAVQLFHLLAGALGLLLLCRRIGLRPAAAVLAGLVFMFGGVAAGRLQHSLMIVSYGYFPWALLLLIVACDSPMRGRRWIAAAGFGLIAAVMALDRDHVAFLNCLMLLAVAAWQIARRLWPRPAAAMDLALDLSPALLIGALVLAIPMLLTLESLAMSTRAKMEFFWAANNSLHPAAFLTLIHPDIFGSLQMNRYWGPGRDPWLDLVPFNSADECTIHLYIGALPFALLAAAMLRQQRPNPYRRMVIGLWLFGMVYTLGAYTPVFRVIFDWVPGVDLFRRANDAAFLVNFGFAMLTAFAAQAVLSPELAISRLAKLKTALLGFGLLSAIAAAIWLGQHFGHLMEMIRALTIGVILLATAGLFIAWGRAKLPPAIFAAGLVMLTAGDLIWHHAGAVFNAHPVATVTAYRPSDAALANEIRSHLGDEKNPGRAEIFGLGGSWQNAAMVYGIEQTLGYNPMSWADYMKASGARQNNHLAERDLSESFTGYDSDLAKALGIHLIASGAPLDMILPEDAVKSLFFLGKYGDAYLYQNAAIWPRVMVAPPHEAADGTVSTAPPSPSDPPIGVAEIVSYRQSRISLRAKMERPGLLILHDLYHPAWTARINNQTVPLLRANGLFRAVALPAGDHLVSFSFEPLSLSSLRQAARRVTAAYLP